MKKNKDKVIFIEKPKNVSPVKRLSGNKEKV